MDTERFNRITKNVAELLVVEKQLEMLLKREEFHRATILDEMREIIAIKKIPFFFVKIACDKPCLAEGEYFVITNEDLTDVLEIEARAMSTYLIKNTVEHERVPAPEEAYYVSTQDHDDVLIFLATKSEYIEKYKK